MRDGAVRVRRDRPTAAAWALALMLTMLMVYLLTLGMSAPRAERVSASPRETRTVTFDRLRAYCVSMGIYDSPEAARIEAAGYAARGAAGCVVESAGKWQALGAMYERERDAKRAAKRLKEKGERGAEVVRLEAGKATLRITASQAELERIEGINALLREQAAALDQLARQLEVGEAQPGTVRTLCAAASTEASEAGKALAAFPGAGESGVCKALCDAASMLAKRLSAVAASEQGPLGMAGMLRLTAMETFLDLRRMQMEMLDR